MTCIHRRISSLLVLCSFCFLDGGEKNYSEQIPAAETYLKADETAMCIDAAFTYQAAYQEGMDIASTIGTPGLPGNIIRPKNSGYPGFKIGFSTSLPRDDWKVGIHYFWFSNQALFKDRNIISGLLYTMTFPDDDTLYNSFFLQFKNQFNRVDICLDRSFYTNPSITFSPWLGILGSWETQFFNFNGRQSDPPNTTDINQLKQDWWAIGPYAGCIGSYFFTPAWAVFIKAGTSIFLANHRVLESSFNNDDPVVYSYSLKDVFYSVEPMIETEMGLFWEEVWEKAALRIYVSWELQTYFSHNGFSSYTSPTGIMGNYSMQGLTTGIRFCF